MATEMDKYGYMLERDSINGKDGIGFLTRNGQNIRVFSFINFNTEAQFRIEDFEVVGTRLIQKVITGVELTGSMKLYYGTPIFLQMLKEYLIDNAALPYFNLTITNDDKTSTLGKQTIVYKNCKLHKLPLSKLDATQSKLDMDVEFSYSGIEILNYFKQEPLNYG